MTMTVDEVAIKAHRAIKNYSMSTDRAQQQAEHRIGASEIGSCRNYLRHMTLGTEYDEGAEDDKYAAFVGSAIGERLEAAYAAEYPGSLSQVDFDTALPSGKVIPCHSDTVDVEANALLDWKTKDGLTLIAKDSEPDRAHVFQIAIYLWGLIQAGILKPGAQAFLMYVDRSGGVSMPHVKEVVVTEQLMNEIDEWIDDSMYAVKHNQEAPKDRPYQWCEVACPFFNTCRGGDTLAEGVVDNPDVILAAKVYQEALAMGREADRMKKDVIKTLEGNEGLIEDLGLALSWTYVGPSEMAFTRAGYTRINFRKMKNGAK